MNETGLYVTACTLYASLALLPDGAREIMAAWMSGKNVCKTMTDDMNVDVTCISR